MKNFNKLCPMGKKLQGLHPRYSLVLKLLQFDFIIFYSTSSKSKDKVKVTGAPQTDLVVWGKNLPSSVGYGRFSNLISKNMLLPPLQRGVVVGLLLSDGWLILSSSRVKNSTNLNARLGLIQSIDHFKYAWAVFSLLSHFCSSYPICRGRTRFGKLNYSIEFFTRALPCFTELYSIFYVNGVKVIPYNIYDLLTPAALAHWISGDGSVRSHGLVICTDSYDLSSVIKLMNVLIIRYRLDCILRYNGQYPRIYIRQASMVTLKNIVEPYMDQTMLYKLGK